MDAMRKQLDMLLGTARNGDVTEVNRKYYDRDVCRLFLSGLCPHELFQLTVKNGFGPVPEVSLLATEERVSFYKAGELPDFNENLVSFFTYSSRSNTSVKRYEEAKAKGVDNYDRELEDAIDRLIVECDRKIGRALKRLEDDDAKAAIAISVSEVTQTPEVVELSKQIKEKLKEADLYVPLLILKDSLLPVPNKKSKDESEVNSLFRRSPLSKSLKILGLVDPNQDLEGKTDLKIQALEIVEDLRTQRADKQAMLLMDAFNKDRASLTQPMSNPPPLGSISVPAPDARTQEMINEKLKRAEELGEEGKIDEAQKALEEAEALKKLPARQEPVLDSSKYTAADVRITDQKLRVCDICGAFLSVYDSDRRLADHFGGKLHLGYIQIREKLADLQEEKSKSRKIDRSDDRRSSERSRDRERESSKDHDRVDSRDHGRDRDRRSRDHNMHHDRDRGYGRDNDRDRSRHYDSRSRRRSRSRSRERSRDYDRHNRKHSGSDGGERREEEERVVNGGRLEARNYSVLNEADIQQRQDVDIKKISTVLSISKVAAAILLRYYNWSVSKVHDEWFADEEKVRNSVGLLDKPVVKFPHGKEMTCGICFETYPCDQLYAAVCGHPFCETCWAGYIGTSINDGPGCLMLRCPDPSCHAAIGQDMISALAPDKDKKKYNRYFIRSYVEDNRKTKWCPSPGCEYAVDFTFGSGSYDVSCRCLYGFCWNCTEEAHRPVDCATVAKWILKNSAESENMNWILANSKPCPKCKRPIEKNQGCMHITCTPPCKFEFCWLCLGVWSEHGERTGGFYACNRYESAKQEGVYDESEKRREMAKNSLERYTHYYERWATNQSSRQKALADLQEMQHVYLEKLSDIQCQPESQLKFIIEAWLQIVECRRVLKWTYAYGFYLPDHEHAKRQFFEYLQGEAESGLERLHQCAEKDLQVYLAAEGPSKDFNEFRTKLAGLTSVTRNYFENLVRALENGLSDVDSQGACSRTLPKSMAGGSSKGRGGKNKGSTSKSSGSTGNDESTHWSCELCTYANIKPATVCEMCNQRR
ncbi:hypothetical protein ACFE04_005388 [Oxalis oulophora]